MTALVVGLWVLVYAACAVTALHGHRRTRRGEPLPRRAEGSVGEGPILLVRPCAGAETGLADRLAATGGADRVLYAVADARDGAVTAARAAARAATSAGVVAEVVMTRARGPNMKADQLARALAAGAVPARAVVVVADSDVDLSEIDLEDLAARARAPGIGAVWIPPVEAGEVRGPGDRVSHAILGASLHAFPLLAGIDPAGMVGKLFAIRWDVLAAVGGFDALRHHLGEDMELARRLRALGLAVVAAPGVAPSMAAGRSLAGVHARYTRWLMVVRAQRTALLASYPLLMAPLPLFASIGALAAVSRDAPLGIAVAAGVFVRLCIAQAARKAAGKTSSPALAAAEALLGDLALIGALLSALSTREVAWRDESLRVGPSGRLEEKQA